MAKRKEYKIELSTGETAIKFAWNTARAEVFEMIKAKMDAFEVTAVPKMEAVQKDHSGHTFGKMTFELKSGIVVATITKIA